MKPNEKKIREILESIIRGEPRKNFKAIMQFLGYFLLHEEPRVKQLRNHVDEIYKELEEVKKSYVKDCSHELTKHNSEKIITGRVYEKDNYKYRANLNLLPYYSIVDAPDSDLKLP